VSGQGWSIAEAERYLESLEIFGIRFGLERIRRLMTALGGPVERFEAVHVVGTNGKSSTTRMIAAILHRHGVRVGAYLSPHLRSFSERVEVDERPIAASRFASAVARAAQAARVVDRAPPRDERVTQFEALTAAAFVSLADVRVEVAAVEAGLGARYDATSVVRAGVLAVTNVALEHTRWLGPTERHVAEEKLAATPRGGVVVAGPLEDEALAVAERVTAERGARLLSAGQHFGVEEETAERFSVRTSRSRIGGVRVGPPGRFQRENFALALAADDEHLALHVHSLEDDEVRDASRSVIVTGRLEVV
jgi:dihydrofolate synthase/folylpolyglutamate synthase